MIDAAKPNPASIVLFGLAWLACLTIVGAITFIFWMSPLGLGFSDVATARLNLPGVFTVFRAIHLGAPILLAAGLAGSLVLAALRKRTWAWRVLLVSAGATVAAQVAMLLFLGL